MKKYYVYKVAVVLVLAGLVACNGFENRKTDLVNKGNKMYMTGHYEQAQQAFNKVLTIDPEDHESRYQLAEALNKQGKVKEAFEQYKTVLNQDEAHLMSRVRAGQLFILNRQFDEAEQLLQQAKKINADNTEVMVFEAGLNVATNNTDAAIVIMEKALKQDANAASVILMMASIHHKTDRPDKALQLLKRGIAKSPDDEAMHLMLANLYANSELKAEAENELNSLIKIRPAVFSHYQRLALFYISDNQLDRAEEVLRASVNHASDGVAAKLYLVEFLAQKRNVDVAMAELLPLIEGSPTVYALRFKLAGFYFKKENSEAVEDTLKEIIELDKQGADAMQARNALAKIYLASKRSEQAKQLVTEVLAKNKQDLEALTLRASLSMAEANLTDAIKDFRTVLLAQPTNIQVTKLLASAHIANNNFILAAENMAKVVAQVPDDVTARQDLIELLFKAGKPLQAENHVVTLLKHKPDDLKALESLFKLRLAQKKWSQAQQITEIIAEKAADKATSFYMSGLAYQAEGKFKESISAFKKSLKINPDAIESLTQLIKSYIAQDQAENAISYLKQLTKTHKQHFIAQNLLGEVYLHEKDTGNAEKSFRQLITIKPEWSQGYKNLALIALMEKKTSKAIEVLEQGLEKIEGATDLMNELVALYHTIGKHDAVIALYQRAYQKQPDSLSVINNYARYLAEYDATKTGLIKAAKLAERLEKSKEPAALDTVAWISFKQGSYNKAQALLEQVVEQGMESQEISYHLGMVYFKQGNMASAKTYLDKALSVKTDFMGIELAREIRKSIENS